MTRARGGRQGKEGPPRRDPLQVSRRRSESWHDVGMTTNYFGTLFARSVLHQWDCFVESMRLPDLPACLNFGHCVCLALISFCRALPLLLACAETARAMRGGRGGQGGAWGEFASRRGAAVVTTTTTTTYSRSTTTHPLDVCLF